MKSDLASAFYLTYNFLMIESDTVVHEHLHLEFIVVFVVSVLIPYVFGTLQDLILI